MNKTNSVSLDGLTILLVEDEPLIGMDVSMTLARAGAEVLGPYRRASEAVDAIHTEALAANLDGAILDVDLGDHTCEPVAEVLNALGIPYILHTGNINAEGGLVERLAAPVVRKPSSDAQLLVCIRKTVSAVSRDHTNDRNR